MNKYPLSMTAEYKIRHSEKKFLSQFSFDGDDVEAQPPFAFIQGVEE